MNKVIYIIMVFAKSILLMALISFYSLIVKFVMIQTADWYITDCAVFNS